MKLFTSASTLAAALLLLSGQAMAGTYKGFSMGANRADGACKSQADWKTDFQTIKGWGKGFNAVRLYSTNDCSTLANAVPAAKAVGFKLLVGVWATDDNKFGAEKAALLSAIKTYGTSWIAAISVGSEDLYRKDITPQKLATEIYDVRGMVRQFDKNIKVGHTDTWTAWVDGANDVVTKACDIAITNGFPYWQGVNSNNAVKQKTFQTSLTDVQNRVKQVNSKAAVWVGETGWPTGGPSYKGAGASTVALKGYYANVGCWLWSQQATSGFWFTAFDAPLASPEVEKHFGIADQNRKLKFSLPC